MFGSFTELLTSLIAEWYSVWQEVTQVKQGLALLVLGWVTACYRCLDSTCSALTQLLQTACEVTNGYISRSELNGTISAGGTGAVMHSIQPHGIDPIIPSCHLLPKREVSPNHTTLKD